MATAKKKIDRSKCGVLTPEFRVSYPHVFKAQAPKPTDKPKFSITMLFPKDSDMSSIQEALKQAKIAAFGADKKNWPKGLQSPVSDGNGHIDKDSGEIKKGYKNHWVIKATSNEDSKPFIADEGGNEILNPSQFYSGCYARAQLLATNWEYMGKEGIMFILDGAQKLRDGEPFGGKKDLSKVFTPVNTGESSFDEETVEDFT